MTPATTGAPTLSDRISLVAAPTQLWAERDGSLPARGVNGLYHGDWRILSAIEVGVAGDAAEPISVRRTSSHLAVTAHCGMLDDASKDPRVLLDQVSVLEPGALRQTVRLSNATDATVRSLLSIALTVSVAPLDLLRAGRIESAPVEVSGEGEERVLLQASRRIRVVAERGALRLEGERLVAEWEVVVPPGGAVDYELVVEIDDAELAVRGVAGAPWMRPAPTGDPRLDRWMATAIADLEGLLLRSRDRDDEIFVAAGAPWYLTLFGRDSLTTARMLLPLGTDLALGTLRALARRQGRIDDPRSAEEPGKILHELRSAPIRIPRDGVVLPPVYFGTIDATALWVSLLCETWRAGASLDEIRSLLPALRAALGWMRERADSDGDVFAEYRDPTGKGLVNQGWKDSADAVRHVDGSPAVGPIALCEVQGYQCRAAADAAALLSALGEPGSGEWATFADDLRERFRARFWVERHGSRYPAIALDGEKRPVASLTSNIGQLIGSGLLDAEEERAIADLIVSDRLASGFGVRTMSVDETGYWRLSYHCGTVWPHDTAIIIEGMLRSGLRDHARLLAGQLLNAAEWFGYRMPELYSGDESPVAYPSACQPQAWAAAAAVVVSRALSQEPGHPTAGVGAHDA